MSGTKINEKLNAWAIKEMSKINIPLKLKVKGKLNLTKAQKQKIIRIGDALRKSELTGNYFHDFETLMKIGCFYYYEGNLPRSW